MKDFVSKQFEGLSEVSDELDSARWSARFDALRSAVLGVASQRDPLMEWASEWLPTLLALQSLGATLGKLLWSLTDVLNGSQNGSQTQNVFADDILVQISEDFQDVFETFPDASHWFLRVDEFDRLIRAVVDDPAAYATVVEVGQALGKLGDDVMGRCVDVLLSPNHSDMNLVGMKSRLQNLEDVLQRALDRLDLHRRIFEG